jgi:hypothetical protein
VRRGRPPVSRPRLSPVLPGYPAPSQATWLAEAGEPPPLWLRGAATASGWAGRSGANWPPLGPISLSNSRAAEGAGAGLPGGAGPRSRAGEGG